MIQLDLTIVRFQLDFFHSSSFISNVCGKRAKPFCRTHTHRHTEDDDKQRRYCFLNRYQEWETFLHDNVDKYKRGEHFHWKMTK